MAFTTFMDRLVVNLVLILILQIVILVILFIFINGSVFSTHIILIVPIIALLVLIVVSFLQERLILLEIRHIIVLATSGRCRFLHPIVSYDANFFALADFKLFKVLIIIVWIFFFIAFSIQFRFGKYRIFWL